MQIHRLLVPGSFAFCLIAPTAVSQDYEPPLETPLLWKDLMGSGSTFQLYGFLRLDGMYDDSRMTDPQIPFAVLSEDPNPPAGAPASVLAEKDDDEYAMSPRLSRLGLRLQAPPVGALGNPELSGRLEIDFYNIGLNDSDSRAAIRMRLAYLLLDWGAWTLLAGQDWDVISPLNPVVNNDLMMWGAGNTGDRRPQLTLRNFLPLGEGRLETAVALAFSGAVGGTPVNGSLTSGENSGQPMLQGRVGYGRKSAAGGTWGLGLWGHLSQESYDATGAGEQDFDSFSTGLDLHVPLWSDKLWVKGEYWAGENVKDIRGGILQGVNPTTGEEIAAEGGWAELAFRVSQPLTLHSGLSKDTPDEDDLDPFMRSDNTVYYAAARWSHGPLSYGLEYLHWTTEYVGLADGEANRFLGFLSYGF